MTDEPIRILVADDHAAFRSGLAALLADSRASPCVGEAETGDEAVIRALELQPDVVLMDVTMPGLDGVAATRRIVDTSPHVAVLVLTMADNDAALFDAVRAGARGYLLKGADRAELLRAIRAVAAGEAIFGPVVARRLMAYFARPRRSDPAAFPELTDREREILDLIARGRSNRRSSTLVLSPRRCATTCRTSSPSSRCATGPRRSSAPARPGSAGSGAGPQSDDPGPVGTAVS